MTYAAACGPMRITRCERGTQLDFQNRKMGGASWQGTTRNTPFTHEITRKRRKGFPSETCVKRGRRIVGDGKELTEKLGRNDLCPCGSGHRFQTVLHAQQTV